MAVSGIDVSHHQGSPDWARVRSAGYEFAVLKATDRPPYSWEWWFHQELPKAKAAGLIPGAYHFLRANGGADQAHYFIETVNESGGFDGMLAMLDVESHPDGSFPTILTVQAFVDEFKRLVPGHTLLLYTGRGFWVGTLGNPWGADFGPLWHAEYEPSVAEIDDGPELDSYGGWDHSTIWQYTSNLGAIGLGGVPGVGAACDVNRFFGDRAALLALTGTQEKDMTPDEAKKAFQEVLDQNARRVFGITDMEAYLEALLAAARSRATPAQVASAVKANVPTVDQIANAVAAKPQIDVDVLAAKIVEAVGAANAAAVANELAARLAG